MRRVALFHVLCTSFQCLAPGKRVGVSVSAFDLLQNVSLVDVHEENLTSHRYVGGKGKRSWIAFPGPFCET